MYSSCERNLGFASTQVWPGPNYLLSQIDTCYTIRTRPESFQAETFRLIRKPRKLCFMSRDQLHIILTPVPSYFRFPTPNTYNTFCLPIHPLTRVKTCTDLSKQQRSNRTIHATFNIMCGRKQYHSDSETVVSCESKSSTEQERDAGGSE
jgi:hypothetical protein